jgi:ATP-dependent RNA helicase RhlE
VAYAASAREAPTGVPRAEEPGKNPRAVATSAAPANSRAPKRARRSDPDRPRPVVWVLIPGPPPRGEAHERPDIDSSRRAGPRTGFDRFDLLPELRRAVEDAGFTEPRPIQEATIPPALEGRDILGLAQTGTGKTAAFALPILQRLVQERSRGRGPRALVVAPTRELAAQVHAEFERLGEHTPLTSVVVFGGVPVARHVRALRRKPDVVVACPGRLLDLLGQRALTLDAVEVLVLDEADHMFDMGFLPDLRRILKALPERRQNLLFSATMPPEIRTLADRVLHRAVRAELGNSRPAETIDHVLCPLPEGDKLSAVERLLRSPDFRSAIVFLRTKRRARRLAERLASRGHSAIALQGNMSQGQRERALAGFRESRHKVLVATDIAARGLDIEGVTHVVNFDVPNTPDAYTHRIGRTGRSERSGKAFTFVTPADADAVRAIEKRLGARIERRDLDAAAGQPARRRNGRGDRTEDAARDGGERARPKKGREKSRGRGDEPSRGERHVKKDAAARKERPAPEPAEVPFGANLEDTPPVNGASRPAAARPAAPAPREERPAADPAPAFGAGLDDSPTQEGRRSSRESGRRGA